jgi:hypothetical protein
MTFNETYEDKTMAVVCYALYCWATPPEGSRRSSA